jgi:hypothetical protein
MFKTEQVKNLFHSTTLVIEQNLQNSLKSFQPLLLSNSINHCNICIYVIFYTAYVSTFDQYVIFHHSVLKSS